MEEKGKTPIRKRTIILLSLAALLLVAGIAVAIHASRIINKPRELFEQPAVQPTATAAEVTLVPDQEPTPEPLPSGMVNFLVLGVDGRSDKPEKSYSEDNHTDTILLAAVDFDRHTVDLISIPRDTFRQIPGSTGYYKINAAVNVGGGLDAPGNAGYLKTCEVVSQMLGGLPVNYFVALYFDAVVDLVDALGGIDYELEDWFIDGTTRYKKGFQHMDGKAVLGYLRTRKGIYTGMDTGDLARVDRQKRMLLAIYQKLKEQDLLSMIPTLLSTLDGVSTNVNVSQMLALANYAMHSVGSEDIHMHTMGGQSRQSADTPWNFVFTDQEKRIALIEEIYGVTVEPETHCSYPHLIYLERYGFDAIHAISVVDEMCAAVDTDALDDEQKAAFDAVVVARDELCAAMDAAATSLLANPQPSSETCSATKKYRRVMQEAAEAFAKGYGYELPHWSVPKEWWNDPYINDVKVDFR